MRLLIAITSTTFALSGLAPSQSTLLVPSQYTTIQGAIAAAQNGDTVLVAPGVYPANLDTLGKSITIRGVQGAAQTTINGQGLGTVMTVTGGQPRIEGLKLTNGTGTANVGGGMLISGGTPVVSDCLIVQNTAGQGAGAWTEACTPTFLRCTFAANTATGFIAGGAGLRIQNVANALIRDCVFDGNIVSSGASLGNGTGAWHSNTSTLGTTGAGVVFESCVFRNNSGNALLGTNGGGFAAYSAATVLKACLFQNNTARYGGAVYVTNALITSAVPTFQSCRIVGNRADSAGGAVSAKSGIFQSCELLGNSVATGGNDAAMNLQDSTTVVESCIFALNYGSTPGTVAILRFLGATGSGTPVIRNCTFARNDGIAFSSAHLTLAATAVNCIFRANTGGDVGGNAQVTHSIIAGVPGAGNFDADPLFVDPQNGDFHLAAGSPAIDAGVPLPVALDFEGDPRWFGAGVDIGADERNTGPVALSLAQPGGPGSANVVVNGSPGFGAFTTFSFLPQAPGTGSDTQWLGLWTRFADVLEHASFGGAPFLMLLDGTGTALWSAPPGSLPPATIGAAVHAVTLTWNPGALQWSHRSPVAHLVLQ